jgi:hypothetical protein
VLPPLPEVDETLLEVDIVSTPLQMLN